jgi:hypothetical protein
LDVDLEAAPSAKEQTLELEKYLASGSDKLPLFFYAADTPASNNATGPPHAV